MVNPVNLVNLINLHKPTASCWPVTVTGPFISSGLRSSGAESRRRPRVSESPRAWGFWQGTMVMAPILDRAWSQRFERLMSLTENWDALRLSVFIGDPLEHIGRYWYLLFICSRCDSEIRGPPDSSHDSCIVWSWPMPGYWVRLCCMSWLNMSQNGWLTAADDSWYMLRAMIIAVGGRCSLSHWSWFFAKDLRTGVHGEHLGYPCFIYIFL